MYTVESRYNAPVGVQKTGPRYKLYVLDITLYLLQMNGINNELEMENSLFI